MIKWDILQELTIILVDIWTLIITSSIFWSITNLSKNTRFYSFKTLPFKSFQVCQFPS